MLLSICIPSYNRFEKLNETIDSILKAKSNAFEVVIVDNCSPRDINEYITCNDARLRIVKRETPVYGGKNVSDCIVFARGKYALMLLDKDTIDGKYLDDFISTILDNQDVMGGYCVLNSLNKGISVVSKEVIATFGYLSKHPSGNFYRIDELRQYIELKENEMERDPFAFDVYMAYCASKGKMMLYDKEMVFSLLDNVDNSKKNKEKSLTFSKDKGNVYYLVPNRMMQFKTYMQCLSELEVSKEEKKRALELLYESSLIHVTLEYRYIMKNKDVCEHYGHETENVNLLKMLYNALRIRSVLFHTKFLGINFFEKWGIDTKVVFLLIKKKISKSKNGD